MLTATGGLGYSVQCLPSAFLSAVMHLSVSSQFDLDSLIGIPTMSALSTSPDVSRSTSPFTFQFPRSRFFFEDVMAEFLVSISFLFRIYSRSYLYPGRRLFVSSAPVLSRSRVSHFPA